MPKVYARQPVAGAKVSARTPLGRSVVAHFNFSRDFQSAVRGRPGSPVVTPGPRLTTWKGRKAVQGNGVGGIRTNLKPSDLGMVGAGPRTVVVEYEQGDVTGGRVLFSLGDSSGTNRSQFSLQAHYGYRTIRLDLYGNDIGYTLWNGGGSIAKVWLAITYDGDVTLTFKSWCDVYSASTGAFLKTETNTQTARLPAPLNTGNTVPLHLLGGGTYGFAPFNAALYSATFFNRCLTPGEVESFYRNPKQIMEPAMAFPYSALPVEDMPRESLLGAPSTQASASSSGAIQQTHVLSGAASTQASTSGPAAIGENHIALGAPSSQPSTSPGGVLSQTHKLVGAASTQGATSPGAAIVQGHALAGAASSQASTSGTGSVGEQHIALGAPSFQPSTSPGGAITQGHALVGASSTSASTSTSGATVTRPPQEDGNTGTPSPALAGASSTQDATSPGASLGQTHKPIGAASTQGATSPGAALGQSHKLVGAPSSQASTSGVGVIGERHIAVGAPSVQPSSSTSGAILQFHRPQGAASTQGSTSPGGAAYQEIDGTPREVTSLTVEAPTYVLNGYQPMELRWAITTTGGASKEVKFSAALGTIGPEGIYTAPMALGGEQEDYITVTPVAGKDRAVTLKVTIRAGVFDAWGLPVTNEQKLLPVIWPELDEPTEAQAESGNYRKDRMKLFGLRIMIENPRGSLRRWRAGDGTRGATQMKFAYGYIAGTLGNDGDELDCTIGPSPLNAQSVYVVNQFIGGKFDEHKIMFGFASQAEAEAAYLGNYSYGWAGLESCVACSMDQLKRWISDGDKSQPLTANEISNQGMTMDKVLWDSANMPLHSNLDQVLYALRRDDNDDGLLYDAVTKAEILADADGVLALDALVVQYARVEQRMAIMQKVLDRTGKAVKVAAMQVSEPFTQRGTTNVAVIYELTDGQTVSVFFHNPDVTPKKITAADDLVSWKWMLNKKDITVAVAPEKGRDLEPRTVAARIMALAEKNSDRFTKANGKRAERMQAIADLQTELDTKKATLAELEQQVAAAQAAADAAGNGDPEPVSPDPQPGPEPEPAKAPNLYFEHIKAVVTTDSPMPSSVIGRDWIVMNAPRPLMGTETTSNGEFLEGRFYAAIDPRDPMAQAYVDENVKNGASVVFVADHETLNKMALNTISSDSVGAYLEMDPEERDIALRGFVLRLNNKTYGELKALAALGMPVAPVVDPEPAPEADPEPETYREYLIYPARIGGKIMFAVQSEENKARAAAGERTIGGDSLHDTIEQARAEVDRLIIKAEADAKSNAEWEAKQAEEAAKAAAARAEFEDVDGFTDGMTAMQKEKALQALNAVVNYRGTTTTRKAIIREKVAAGFYIENDETDGRILTDGDVFQGVKQITKTGLDYAAYLISKRPAPEPIDLEDATKGGGDDKEAQAAQEAADGDFLALAAEGNVDFYDKAVTDRLAALARKYTDPEGAYLPMIERAKTAAKNWFVAEFKKRVG